MKRFVVVLALVATACGSVTVSPNRPGVDENTNSPSAAADGADESSDGRPAPDFVLALGEGGEFSPSSEDKPIYMVFWAEW
jgi:hypothetical protein